MPGQLPIDRARASKHDPKQLERQKQRFSKKEAQLKRKAREHDDVLAPEKGKEAPNEDEE